MLSEKRPIPAVERGFAIAGKPTLPIERSYGELGVDCCQSPIERPFKTADLPTVRDDALSH